MTIKRKAILISSPKAPGADDFTEGTRKDVSNWMSFLASTKGGCWDVENEIKIFQNGETKQDLDDYLDELPKIDYLLFYYSGHGDSVEDYDYIRMGQYGEDPVNVQELKRKISTKTIRGSMIIDACRCAGQPVSHAYDNPFKKMNESCEITNTRTTWESSLFSSNKAGVVLIQSCESKYLSSMQANNASSLFSDMMIYEAEQTEDPKSIVQIFSDARKDTIHISKDVWVPPQPQYPECDNYEANYPFSLGAHFANAMDIMNQSNKNTKI